MTFIYRIFIFEIIIPQLFLRDLQAKYRSNHAKHPKELVLCYILSPFYIIWNKGYNW